MYASVTFINAAPNVQLLHHAAGAVIKYRNHVKNDANNTKKNK